MKKLKVRDFMVPKPLVFTEDTDLHEAAQALTTRRVSGAPVIDDRGTLVGVLTERDLLQAVVTTGYHDEGGGRVRDYMTREVEVVSLDDSLFEVAKRFVDGKYRRFPVIDDNRVVGLVTRRDVLRVLLEPTP